MKNQDVRIDMSRTDMAVALGAAIGLHLAVTRVTLFESVVAVMTALTPDAVCLGFLKIPHVPNVPVVRSCADYDDQFEFAEDAVRSFCAI